jgi:putative tryptophan/tyrosine transport system substrate-binding protein
MKRREFIAGLGSAAIWPVVVRAQQSQRMRRIGVLINVAEGDPTLPVLLAAFEQGLQELSWTVGGNIRIDYRFGAADPDLIRKYAEELVALAPDVILAQGASAVGPLRQVTRVVPIVFVATTDPVGSGFAASLARPGGNATGFSNFEFGLGGKWLGLLKQIAPRVTRVAVIRDPLNPIGIGEFAAIQSVTPSFGVKLTPIGLRDSGEIERDVAAFARGPNGGLIVTTNVLAALHRGLIITLAARHKLPAVYPMRFFVTDGGLMSYGPDIVFQYRLAAGYVDRIFKGEKPADLPVQAPTKFETAINLKTAKALGLSVPETLLATADEVIQ